MTSRFQSLLALTIAACLCSCAPVALRPLHATPPTVGSVAPEGCDWVVRQKQGNDRLYLCCAEPGEEKPVCKEARWFDPKPN